MCPDNSSVIVAVVNMGGGGISERSEQGCHLTNLTIDEMQSNETLESWDNTGYAPGDLNFVTSNHSETMAGPGCVTFHPAEIPVLDVALTRSCRLHAAI